MKLSQNQILTCYSLLRLSQKSEQPLFYALTTKAVGSNFITYLEPTALVVGARILNCNH